MNSWNRQQIIKGVSYFDGVIDGKEIKSGSVFIEEQMDERGGNAKGFRTVEYKTTADVVKRIIHNEFPINGDVTFAMKVSKGSNTVVVEELKPLGRVAGQPHSAPQKVAA
jgi:hypothetical protein